MTTSLSPIKCFLLEYGFHNYTNGPCCHVPSFDVGSYQQLKKDPRYIEIKQSMDSGQWHRDCSDCQSIESSSDGKLLSKRQMWAPWFDQVEDLDSRDLTVLFFDTGKLCNLACRSCSPYCSSSWVKEWNQMHAVPRQIQQYQTFDRKSLDLEKQSFQHLRFLELLGGEPLYNLDSYGVMQRAIQETNNQCMISIATNGMFFPDLAKYPWFQDNSNILIIFSIDAVGPAAEFIRTGSNWSRIQDNIKKYQDLGVKLGHHVTHSVLNLFELDHINHWRIEQGFTECELLTIVNEPAHLSFSVLTDREKDKICQYLSSRYGRYLIPSIEKSVFDPVLREKFLKFMAHTQAYHGLDWQEYLPELYRMISDTTVDFS